MNARLYAFDERCTGELRVPPWSLEAEQAVLGGLMLAPEMLVKIADWITPENFYRRDHQLIYRAILELDSKRQPCDAVTLMDWFHSQGLSAEVDGGAYLIELASTTPSAANIVAYAEIVVDKARLRELIDVGTRLQDAGFQPEGRETRDLIAEAEHAIARLADRPRIGGIKTMQEVARRWFDDLQCRYSDKGRLYGLPTPWGKFNAMTGGLAPGQLIILAARPGMGKSAWAVNVATANALHGKRVLFFNLEMTDVSIFNRCIASVMNVPLQWLREPNDDCPDSEMFWSQVTEGVRRMRDAGLMIDDTPGLNREQIMARARREHLRQPVDLIIIDHLHLMPLPGKTRETVEIGEITRDLKGLGKELGCPVVLLAQLNRGVEARQNKRPVMKDLRESGNIEQDADLIVFLYRDDYYAEQEDRASEYPGFLEINIAKQREGQTGRVWARSRLAYGYIDDYEGEPPQGRVSVVSAPSKARMRWSQYRDDQG
ncbi:replicative DNA helicase [Xylella fastidiosa subsp. sandyi]|uniref:replicative DNA helicase n=1 Tax=Xylella fastidiosa TaxID=2371 RepID=UPI000FFEDECB|nr:replicative DNA helicase [Xylella fastidiosa]RWA43550.1 replicative DNA helicase [Xylella fastidiosa subsp. sandyi]